MKLLFVKYSGSTKVSPLHHLCGTSKTQNTSGRC